MTSDHFLCLCGADYLTLQREHCERGFSGESHDMSALRHCQAWRILEGAEPSKFLSMGEPAAHMRYGPYREGVV